jgi:hypothetical protein
MMRRSIVIAFAVTVATAGLAGADSLGARIARHDLADVAILRARLSDKAARCALGAVYLLRDDLTRAAIYLDGCATERMDPEMSALAKLAVRRLGERLAMGDYAPVELATLPANTQITIDTVEQEWFSRATRIWLPAGEHKVKAGYKTETLVVRPREFVALTIDLRGTGETPWPDPGLAPHPEVMRENDCKVIRLRYPSHECRLPVPPDDDALDFDIHGGYYHPLTVTTIPRPTVRMVRDMTVNIVASAEGLW